MYSLVATSGTSGTKGFTSRPRFSRAVLEPKAWLRSSVCHKLRPRHLARETRARRQPKDWDTHVSRKKLHKTIRNSNHITNVIKTLVTTKCNLIDKKDFFYGQTKTFLSKMKDALQLNECLCKQSHYWRPTGATEPCQTVIMDWKLLCCTSLVKWNT